MKRTNETEARKRVDSGVDFVAVNSDVALIGRAAISLVDRIKSKGG
jgi:2-keto-3-deoxy-L-rhamnonate aldolase RhmA